jgi:hypothetical protein
VLASGGEGSAQQAQDATGELNFVVTRRVQVGKEEEVEAILRDLQATTLAMIKVVSGMSGIGHQRRRRTCYWRVGPIKRLLRSI